MANTVKGFAHDWLFATVEMLDWTADQLTWTNLKPRFQRQFATQTDEKMIIEGLSNLAMNPHESTGELLARITNTESIQSNKKIKLQGIFIQLQIWIWTRKQRQPEWKILFLLQIAESHARRLF